MNDGQKILVVDDSWVVLENLRKGLVAAGYAVKCASSEATALLQVPWAELVIVDFHMPGENGAAMLPRLKKVVPASATCNFYLYTSDAEVARRYRELGFEGGFIRKGDETALLPQVEAAFRTIKLRQLATSLRAGRKTGSPKS